MEFESAPYGSTPEPLMLSQGQAARWCRVSPTTIRRAREEGRLPNAVQTGEGWHIPVPDLLAAGFKVQGAPAPLRDDGAPQTAPPSASPGAPPAQGSAPPAAGELEQLRRQLAETQQRAQLAETRATIAEAEKRAAERLVAVRTEQVEDLRGALRILEAGHINRDNPDPIETVAMEGMGEPEPLDEASPFTEAAPKKRPRWWQRRR